MSAEELQELLAHPMLQGFIDRRAELAARRALKGFGITVSYGQAADIIGCEPQLIRTFLYRGQLARGKAPRTLTLDSVLDYAERRNRAR